VAVRAAKPGSEDATGRAGGDRAHEQAVMGTSSSRA